MDLKNLHFLEQNPYKVSWKADGTRWVRCSWVFFTINYSLPIDPYRCCPWLGGIGFSSPSLGFFLRVDWYAQSLCPSDLSASEVLIYYPGLLVKTWKKYQHGLCFSLRCYLRNLNAVNQPELASYSGGNVECALQTTDKPAEGTGQRRHTVSFLSHFMANLSFPLVLWLFVKSDRKEF